MNKIILVMMLGFMFTTDLAWAKKRPPDWNTATMGSLKYRVEKINHWTGIYEGKLWLRLMVENSGDSLVVINPLRFSGIDSEGNQSSVPWADTNDKPKQSEAAFEMSESNVIRTGVLYKSIMPGARIHLGLYFDREVGFKKPFQLYYDSSFIMDVSK
ncbi:hypothetical protein LLH00_18380 [bacterium]|nr:hypothetical protein [bacterium]